MLIKKDRISSTSGINKTISDVVNVMVIFIILYMIIQLTVFYFSQKSVTENLIMNEKENIFFNLNNNIMELESSFLNYESGYIPSPNKINLLLEENDVIISNFIVDYAELSEDNTLQNLGENHSKLKKQIKKYLVFKGKVSDKQILLKEINETFFVCRLLAAKLKKNISDKAKSNTQNIRKIFYINLISLSLLVIVTILLITSIVQIKQFISRKINFLQKSIIFFSKSGTKMKIDYKENDEFKVIFDTFNEMTSTIVNQHNKIKESEKRFKYLYNNHPDGLTLMLPNQEMIDCNQTTLKLFECSSTEEFKILSETGGVSPDFQPDGIASRKKAEDFIKKTLSTGINNFEWVFTKKSGKEFLATVILAKMEINGEVYLQETIRDITEKKKEEEKLIQSQKMETIGTLAGGIAHDFNNVLSGIIGSVSILEYKILKNDVSQEIIEKYLHLIHESSDRAKNMVNQLLLLSRKQELLFTVVDLVDTIHHVIEIANSSFDKSVRIIFEPKDEKYLVKADSTQLEQVFLNFFVNASHAMTIMRKENEKWGGVLEVTIDEITNYHADNNGGDYWCISVKDSGIGMNNELLKKIFNPFFTTKNKGEGTGLGLSMAYNIVNQHKGFINVYSEPGIGTKVNTYLPILSDEREFLVKNERKFDVPHGSGLILVIDDELIMREMATAILTECGYTTITAENGKEGIEIFREKKDNIKVIILDMVMPEIGGKEAFAKIKEIKPNTKILLSSGFREDERVQSVLKLGADGFLQKPYTLEKLASAINDILNIF